MAHEIKAAADRYNERKEAAAVEGQGRGGQVVGDDVVALVTSGLDLDVGELHDGQRAAIDAARRGLMAGVPVTNIVGGLWVDGVVTGVMLQQARERTDWETVARQLADWMVEEDDRDGATAEEFIERARR